MRPAFVRRAVLVAVIATAAACTIHDTNPPALSGPSELALTLRVTAVPANLSFGVNPVTSGEQSAITVLAIGADGRPVPQLPVRLNMVIDGVAQDYGTLRERNIVTGTDGTASTTYTAPPIPSSGTISNNCGGATLGTCVAVVATPASNGFGTVSPQSVLLRLVPTGTILPPADTPTASFQFSPSAPAVNQPITFDATTSQSVSAIVSYFWSFGDGTSGSGPVVTHAYPNVSNFTVTLTVTNERGGTASTTHTLAVSGSGLPTASFTTSPAAIGVGDAVFFNGASSTAAPNRTIRSFEWDFGDGSPLAFGVNVTHVYTAANLYTVTLKVTDDIGQQNTKSASLSVGTGAPIATFTFSVADAATHRMTFDGSGSVAVGGATIVSYAWAFGDGQLGGPSAQPSTTHPYSATGTYSVRLTVTDDRGRVGTSTAQVAVP